MNNYIINKKYRSNFISTYKNYFLILKGKNCKEFLNKFLTKNILNIKNNIFYSALCNFKGKVILIIMLFKFKNKIIINFFNNENKKYFKNFLKKYIFKNNIKFINIKNYICFTLYGNNIDDILKNIYNKFNIPELYKIKTKYGILIRFKNLNNFKYYKLLTNNLRIKILLPYLLKYLTPINNKFLNLINIHNKIPFINKVNRSMFFPQILNLYNIKAISNNKGCYLGQEMILKYDKINIKKKNLMEDNKIIKKIKDNFKKYIFLKI